MDPLVDEQASQAGIDDLAPIPPPNDRPWREPTPPASEADPEQPLEATGMAGGGMPEAASQAEEPGTDSDIRMPPVKKRINLDQV